MSSTAVASEWEMCEARVFLLIPCSTHCSFHCDIFNFNNIYIRLLEFARQQIESSQMKQNDISLSAGEKNISWHQMLSAI